MPKQQSKLHTPDLIRGLITHRVGDWIPHQVRDVKRLSIVCISLIVTSCSLWNNYETPETPEPATWIGAPEKGAWPDKDWWKNFNSPELSGLIEKAETQNYDIRAAMARVREADAQAQIAGAALWPSVDATASATRTREAINSRTGSVNNLNSGNVVIAGTNGGKHRYVSDLNGGLNASYELDFWGKNWAARESAEYSADASRYDAETIRLTTVSDVANTYFTILSLQDRLAIAHKNLDDAKKLEDAIQRRFNAGLATSIDLAQQQNLSATVAASIPPLDLQLRQNTDALSLLLGKLPESQALGKPGMLEELVYPKIQPGLPSELLQRRPDVQNAEAQLHAANLDITNAHAQFFPSIGLTAQGGLQSTQLSNFVNSDNLLLGVGANLMQPIFEGFALLGQYTYSKQRYNELLDDYRKSAISAFSDVEDALSAVQQAAAQEEAQNVAVKTAQKAYDGSLTQLKGGIIDIRNLLDIQRSLFSAQDQLIQVRLQHLQALVGLYRVLGGGWEDNQKQ